MTREIPGEIAGGSDSTEKQTRCRVWLLVLIVTVVLATLLGSGCDRSITEPDSHFNDTSDAEGAPAELSVQLKLTPVQAVAGSARLEAAPGYLTAVGAGCVLGFSLTHVAEACSLLLERDSEASPLRSQRDLRGHVFFEFSWHLAARKYV